MAAGTKLTGAVGAFYMAADSGTDVTAEAVGTGDGNETAFALDHGNVDAVKVYLDGTEQDPGAFTVTPAGAITFATAPDADAVITADYTYYAMAEILGFFEWSMDVASAVLDGTDFEAGAEGWENKLATILNWKGSAKRYYVADSAQLGDKAGARGIVKLFTNNGASQTRWEGWGEIVDYKTGAKVKELIQEELTFEGSEVLSHEEG